MCIQVLNQMLVVVCYRRWLQISAVFACKRCVSKAEELKIVSLDNPVAHCILQDPLIVSQNALLRGLIKAHKSQSRADQINEGNEGAEGDQAVEDAERVLQIADIWIVCVERQVED